MPNMNIGKNGIEIQILGDDQVSDDLLRITGNLDKLKKKTTETTKDTGLLGKATSGMSTQFKGLATTLAGPLLGFTALSGAVVGVSNFLKSSINDWVDYNEEIRKLGAATGTGVEDLSRLMQAADDMGVSMEGMKTALVYASKNGVKPTIEGIAQLSDRLLAITDTTKRSAEMQRLFGRGYAEVAGFVLQGSDAIKEATGAIEDNMVVTDDSAKAARNYALAIDNLQDTFTGLKNEVAQGAIPVLTEFLDIVSLNIKADKARKEAFELTSQAFREGLITSKEYNKSINSFNVLFMDSVDVLNNATIAIETYTPILQEAGLITKDYVPTQEALTRAYEQSIPAMAYYAAQSTDVKESLEDLEGAAKGAGKGVAFLFDQLDTDITGDIAKSLDQIAYKLNFGDVVNNAYTQAKEKIKSGAFTPQEGMEVMKGLFVAAEALKVKAGEIDFSEAGRNIANNLGLPLSQAVDWLQRLISKDGAKMNYTAILNILYAGAGRQYEPYRPGASGSKTENSGSGPKGANGLDLIVPPGYANDSYPIWTQSGERVIVIPKGETAKGSNYNLTIYTNAPVESMVKDFNMMRTWARV